MEKFSYLYYFENDALTLVESKRLDSSTSASLSDVYKWTVFEKDAGTFSSLSFRSMNKIENEEFRSFKEGELSFTSAAGEFKYQGQTISLKLLKPDALPKDFRKSLETYLFSIPQHH